jgi:hypothetical protein
MGKRVRMEDEVRDDLEYLFWDDIHKKEEAFIGSKSPFGTTRSKSKGPVLSKRLLFECTHWRQKFNLQGGVRVFASAWMDKPICESSSKKGFQGTADIGFYLDTRWASDRLLISPGTKVPFRKQRSVDSDLILYPWPDYGIPKDTRRLIRTLKWLLAQATKGQIVEVGCMGGHGRTGTVLAALLALQGVSARSAIRRVRRNYCEEAIESDRQFAFIRGLT